MSENESQPEMASQPVKWAPQCTGGWAFDATECPDYADPGKPWLYIKTDEQYRLVADHVVREKELVVDGVGVVDEMGEITGVVVVDLIKLIDAVQNHENVRLAKVTEPDKEGHIHPDGVVDVRGNSVDGDATTLVLNECVILAFNEDENAFRDTSNRDTIIGVNLIVSSHFAGQARFSAARFAGSASFKRSSFADSAWFFRSSFAGLARFSETSFAGLANFEEARFAGWARFREASFAEEATFDGAGFAGEASFDGASFAGKTSFGGVRFTDTAWFNSSYFEGETKFDYTEFELTTFFIDARFTGQASFDSTRFTEEAWFDSSSFTAKTWFGDAYFMSKASFDRTILKGETWFHRARFAGEASFDGPGFAYGASFDDASFVAKTLASNLRSADVRNCRILPDRSEASDATENAVIRRIPAFARPFIQRLAFRVNRWSYSLGWTLLRSIGELSILTRVSVLALVLVPPLASAWPAIRAGVVGYNEAVTDASVRFDTAADSLREAQAELDQLNQERLTGVVADVEKSIKSWSDRFGGMTIDSQDLPPSLAWTFFAAAALTIAQLIYQIRAPALIKKHDEDSFVESMHQRYPEDAKDRNDGLRRACDWLAAITKIRTDRHENLIEHHGEMVWVPSKAHIELFQDIELADPNTERAEGEAAEGEHVETKMTSYPEGYVPAAERARIAIEEGAKAEYWMVSRENRFAAWLCFVFYLAGLSMLLWILYIQTCNVVKAAWP